MSKAEDKAQVAYPAWRNGIGDEFSSNSAYYGFIEGYQQAERDLLDNIWHSPDEEPEIDRKIIWESENFLSKHLDKEWKPKIDCFGRKERWCYLADILPSKNWTGERPYSKVDYSRGYEQAEKDLLEKKHERSWRLDEKLWSGIKDVEEASYQYMYDASNDWAYEIPTWQDIQDAFKAGNEWKENLKLTWEDIFTIYHLVNEVLDDYTEGKTKKEVGEEVLRRFKVMKDE